MLLRESWAVTGDVSADAIAYKGKLLMRRLYFLTERERVVIPREDGVKADDGEAVGVVRVIGVSFNADARAAMAGVMGGGEYWGIWIVSQIEGIEERYCVSVCLVRAWKKVYVRANQDKPVAWESWLLAP